MRAAAILLILMAGCRAATPDSQRTAGDTSVAAVVADSTGTYELDLPARWQGHFRVDSLSTAERGRAQPGAFVFQYLPSDSTLRPQALLVIAVYDSAVWRAVLAEGGPSPGDSVAARNGRVYVVGLPQSNPFAPGSTDATVFSLLELRPAEVATLVRLR
jgi:hypothetical protein